MFVCNNGIFTGQYVFNSIFINSFYNLGFRSVLFYFILSIPIISFKNIIFIQKLYFHSITFQFVYIGLTGQSGDRMIFINKH